MKITDTMVLFWNGIYSNWEPSKFFWNGMEFNCGEQYMMYRKAEIFGDERIAKLVMEAKLPGHQKALGREVCDFDPDYWSSVCVDVMVEGLTCKFKQNPTMKEELLATGDRIIAEASPVDKIWGIGLNENDPRALLPSLWLGQNLLGITLMKVRDILKNDI